MIDDTRQDQQRIDNLIEDLNELLTKYKLNNFFSSSVSVDTSSQEHICKITSKDLPEYDVEVELRYEDASGEPLKNFLPFTYNEYKSSYNKTFDSFIKENVSPYAADHIGVYDKNTQEKLGELPLSRLSVPYDSKRLYRVGLLSDIHFNETDTSDDDPDTHGDDGSEYYNDVLNVLNYFGSKTEDDSKVDFISVAGDISTNSINHIRNFYLMLKKYAQVDGDEIPFFSCYGNHDHAATVDGRSSTDGNFNLWDDTKYEGYTHVRHWNQLMCSEEYKEHLEQSHGLRNFDHYIDDIDDTGYATFSFEKVLPNNKFDVYIYFSVNYDRLGESRATKRIFYNKDSNELTKAQENINKIFEYTYQTLYPGKKPEDRTAEECTYDVQIYDSGAIIWLLNKLEQYKEHRVFIFTHQFFPHKAGNYNNEDERGYYSYAGLSEPGRISSGSSYCLSGIQFEMLNYLNNKYSNAIWFTGHSHYKWEWQQYDPTINVTNKEYDYICPLEEHYINYWRQNPNLRYLRYKDNISQVKSNRGQWYESYRPDGFFKMREMLIFNIKTKIGKSYKIYVDANCVDTSRSTQNNKLAAMVDVYDKDTMVMYASSSVMKRLGSRLVDNDVQNFTLEFTAISEVTQIRLRTLFDDDANWLSMRINSEDIEILSCVHQLQDGTEVDTSYNKDLAHPVIEGSGVLPTDDYIIYEGDFKLLNVNTAYNVHLPSTCRPIPLHQRGYGISGLDSQGAILDVYEDYVEIRGIVFKDALLGSEYINKYIPIAQYRIPLAAK